jgi:hypothetical protein
MLQQLATARAYAGEAIGWLALFLAALAGVKALGFQPGLGGSIETLTYAAIACAAARFAR